MKQAIFLLALFSVLARPVHGQREAAFNDASQFGGQTPQIVDFERVTDEMPLRPLDPQKPDFRELPFGEPSYWNPLCGVNVGQHWTYWRCYGYTSRPSDSYLCSHVEFIFGRTYRPAVSRGFLATVFSSIAIAAGDVETQQYALRMGASEANPLIGRSRAQGYGVAMGLLGLETYFAWQQKRRNALAQEVGLPTHKYTRWWMAFAINDAFHVTGITFNLIAASKR